MRSVGILILSVHCLVGCSNGSNTRQSKEPGVVPNTSSWDSRNPFPYPNPVPNPVLDPTLNILCPPEKSEVCAIEAEVWRQTNAFREAGGLLFTSKKAMSFGTRLSYAARRWSEKVASGQERFGHAGFKNRKSELEGVFTIDSELSLNAENIAQVMYSGSPAQIARDAVESWRKSPGHWFNMIGNYESLGVGVAIGTGGKVYLTQIMGKDSMERTQSYP